MSDPITIKRARTMRREGISLKRIAQRLEITEGRAWELTSDIPVGLKRKSRVGYHHPTKRWCIYVFQQASSRTPTYAEPQRNNWWPLEWAGWDTKELAQAYLDKHGDFQPKGDYPVSA